MYFTPLKENCRIRMFLKKIDFDLKPDIDTKILFKLYEK